MGGSLRGCDSYEQSEKDTKGRIHNYYKAK